MGEFTMRLPAGVCWAVVLAWSCAVAPAQDSADKDYSAELPRIPPTEPKDALKTFAVQPGFKLELAAAEPNVADPTAICWDENGRLFVVEMRGYSEERDEKLSRIRMLQDENGDGVYEKSSVFADGLLWPTALFWWKGGLIVGDPPELIYLQDTDGDGKAEKREVLFTGFSRDNVQGMMNSLTWGLDNRIHGAGSSGGGQITSPTQPDKKPLVVRGRDFAIEPRSMVMETTTGGAQHGMSFDDWGTKFLCHNSDHLQMVVHEERYLSRNPYLAAAGARRSIAADGPQGDVYRISPVEPWRVIRTRLRVKGIVPGPVEGGGRAAGYFTSATGVTIYRGDAWPEEYHGLAIVGDVGSNIIHRKRLEPAGVAYLGKRIDEKSEFVASKDTWFRPVQYANGPDGCLYVCDMYRETIEHPASIPPILKKHIDLTSGRDRGRIYRIAPEGFQSKSIAWPGKMTTAELVALLDHPNAWQRLTASRLLYERSDRTAVPLLEKLASDSKSPLGRMHALYALDGFGALTASVLLPRLSDEHARVREHAVRLAEEVANDAPEITAKLVSMTDDDALRVRFQLANTLGALKSQQRIAALLALAKNNVADADMRIAIQGALATGAGEVLAALVGDAAFVQSAGGKSLVQALATQVGKQQGAADVAALVGALSKLPADSPALSLVVQSFAAKPDSSLGKQLAAATGGKADEVLKTLVAESVKTAADREKPAKARAAALARLRLSTFAAQAELLESCIAPSEPAEVQAAAIGVLSSFAEPEIGELLVEKYPRLGPQLRAQAADALFSRNAWLPALLTALEAKKIFPADLDPARVRLLTQHSDEAVAARARKLVAGLALSSRGQVVAQYRPALTMKGEASRGREAFKKHCAACHKLQGAGHDIGPNLATMKNRGAEAILLNLLDPNREVNPQYLNYLVRMNDGRQLNGLIAAESASSVTLRRNEGATDTLLRIDIDDLKSSGLSLMPEGLEKQLDPQAVADLIAYLLAVE
jgi:putative membrane-bound dehydrogenase-like protein